MMDLPQTSPQREALGRKREELTQQRERMTEKYLAYVAWMLLSYSREYSHKKDTVEGRSVILSFESKYKPARENYERQATFYDNQIIAIDKQVEDLARRGQ